MTHEELYRKLDGLWHDSYKAPGYKALRAVVELHQQLDDNSCYDCVTWYPCPTIQAIEKALS